MLKHASTNGLYYCNSARQYRPAQSHAFGERVKEIKVKPIQLWLLETTAAGFGKRSPLYWKKDVKKNTTLYPSFATAMWISWSEVSGLSMYPHFNPGDVIACTILKDKKFFTME